MMRERADQRYSAPKSSNCDEQSSTSNDVELTLETRRGDTVCWSWRVWQHFETLRNVLADVTDTSRFCAASRLAIPTTEQDDTLLYLGALVEWHEHNDKALSSSNSALCRSAHDAEQNAHQWLATRTETTRQFDMLFLHSLLDARPGLLGDLVRTVEFLDAPHWMALLGTLIDSQIVGACLGKDVVALRCALYGGSNAPACAATCSASMSL